MNVAAFVALGVQALPLIEALLKDAPHLITDVKNLIASLEGKPAAEPAQEGPLAPQVIKETQPYVDKLQGK